MTDIENCPKCHKPLRTENTDASLTQWIFGRDSCKCEVLSEIEASTDYDELGTIDAQTRLGQSETISICQNCHKRISYETNTVTQWIFGKGRCECDRPEPVDTPVEQFISPSLKDYGDIEEGEIELSADSFPLERYKAIGEIGRGASGVVYLCRDRMLANKVAVKTLLNLDADQLISFQNEAKSTARLNHPNIVKVIDFGASQAGTPYMVMHYVPGISLAKYLEQNGFIEEAKVREIFIKLAKALQYAHSQGVLHRDIKPSNIMLYEYKENIEVCLIDFGVASVKESTGLITIYKEKSLVGTPTYMSPDQFNGQKYDEQSELYSLGCVLYEALTGSQPFTAETPIEIVNMHVKQAPPLLSEINTELSSDISEFVDQCLAKSKENRIKSMEEFVQRLSTVEQSKIEDLNNNSELPKRNWAIPITIGATLTLIVSVSLLYFTPKEKSPKQKSKPAKVKFETVIRYDLTYYQPINEVGEDYDLALKQVGKRLKKKSYSELINLNLTDWKITGSGLKYLRGIPIKRLMLRRCSSLENSNLKHLTSLPLSYLNLEETNINGKGLSSIFQTSSLNNLVLDSCMDIKDEDLKNLRELKNLKRINLTKTSISDKALEYLAKAKGLEYIVISHTSITNSGVKSIGNLDKLKGLHMDSCPNLNKETISLIAELFPNLLYLDISGLNIQPGDLAPIKRCKRLRNLRLIDLPIGSLDLEAVATLQKLNYLNLRGTPISGQSLEKLYNCKSLRNLVLNDCSNLSLESIHRFKQKFGNNLSIKSIRLRNSKINTKNVTPFIDKD